MIMLPITTLIGDHSQEVGYVDMSFLMETRNNKKGHSRESRNGYECTVEREDTYCSDHVHQLCLVHGLQTPDGSDQTTLTSGYYCYWTGAAESLDASCTS